MRQRKYKRIPVSFPLRLTCLRTYVPGTVTNLSENGLFINTELCFPLKSKMDVLIKLKEEILKVPVEIVRVLKSDHKCMGIGVRILNLPKRYVEFISKSYHSYQS
jgi:hypothetical protein